MTKWGKEVCAKLVVLQCQIYVSDVCPGCPHASLQRASRARLACGPGVAMCQLCVRGMRSHVLWAARECVSVSSPSRASGVVVSHGLSLQCQLSCFFPPNFTPPPSHAPPTPTPRSVSLLSSIPLPCSAPSERLQSVPWEGVSHFSWLCPPAPCPSIHLSHCLSAPATR